MPPEDSPELKNPAEEVSGNMGRRFRGRHEDSGDSGHAVCIRLGRGGKAKRRRVGERAHPDAKVRAMCVRKGVCRCGGGGWSPASRSRPCTCWLGGAGGGIMGGAGLCPTSRRRGMRVDCAWTGVRNVYGVPRIIGANQSRVLDFIGIRIDDGGSVHWTLSVQGDTYAK
jgi:hypothetical protein